MFSTSMWPRKAGHQAKRESLVAQLQARRSQLNERTVEPWTLSDSEEEDSDETDWSSLGDDSSDDEAVDISLERARKIERRFCNDNASAWEQAVYHEDEVKSDQDQEEHPEDRWPSMSLGHKKMSDMDANEGLVLTSLAN